MSRFSCDRCLRPWRFCVCWTAEFSSLIEQARKAHAPFRAWALNGGAEGAEWRILRREAASLFAALDSLASLVAEREPKSHPATEKAWAWFEEHQAEMTYERRERVFLALAELDAELHKIDNAAMPVNALKAVAAEREGRIAELEQALAEAAEGWPTPNRYSELARPRSVSAGHAGEQE